VRPAGQAASRVLRHVLRFFAVNSDGAEPSPAHGPSHLNDATIRGGPLDGQRVDLTGDWMDAGDTLKFTQTTSYTVAALLLAARLSPRDLEPLPPSAEVGVRWLLKAHPARGVFVSQVGDIASDHDRDPAEGVDPAADDRSQIPATANRPALTGIGYDSGGRTAAALALAAQFEQEPQRRAQLLAAAREWYVGGGADRSASAGGSLPELERRGRHGLAAIELYRAGSENQDLTDALDWLNGVDPSAPPNWDAVGVLAAAELCGAAGAPAPSPDAATVGCSFLRSAASAFARLARWHALGTAGFLSFGTTATHGGAGAALAMAAAAGFPSGRVLAGGCPRLGAGTKPVGRSFAGLGPKAPRNPHHWALGKGRGAFRGAVVGGPTTLAILREQRLPYRRGRFDGPAGVYQDKVSNYVTSEAAIDYAASTVLLLAAVGAQERE
jgi:endoglucanase